MTTSAWGLTAGSAYAQYVYVPCRRLRTRSGPRSRQTKPGKPESWRSRLASFDAATFVATWEGEDVGLVTGAPFHGREGAAGLYAMWTAPERRSNGIATRLVEAVVAWARASGYGRVLLDVADANPTAIRLYERTGFKSTGVTGTLPAPRSHIREHEREPLLPPPSRLQS